MTRYAANTVARRVVDNPGALDVSKADYSATKGALRIITVGPGKAAIPAGFLAAGGGGYALGRRNGRRTVAAKGFFRQGLVPRIARKAPAAATAAKPVAHKEIAPGVKYLGPSTPGMRGRQAVIKRGEWKTIDQREVSQRKARKTQRRGLAAASVGGSYAGYRYVTGLDTSQKERDILKPSRNANPDVRGASHAAREMRSGRVVSAVRGRPGAAAVLGTTALAAGGLAGMAQGKAREAYQQHKINERRRARRVTTAKRRSYDPEGSRQFNRGALASATGIGGLGALGFAGREAHGATRVARAGAPMAPHKGNVAFVEFEDSKSGKTLKAKLVNQRMVHDADRLKSGFAISRRGLGAGAAGLGLLAASAKTAKTRHEQRWT